MAYSGDMVSGFGREGDKFWESLPPQGELY